MLSFSYGDDEIMDRDSRGSGVLAYPSSRMSSFTGGFQIEKERIFPLEFFLNSASLPFCGYSSSQFLLFSFNEQVKMMHHLLKVSLL